MFHRALYGSSLLTEKWEALISLDSVLDCCHKSSSKQTHLEFYGDFRANVVSDLGSKFAGERKLI